VIDVPLLNQTAKGLAAGPDGGFVVLGSTAVSAYGTDSFQFASNYGSGFILGDAGFTSAKSVVAIGVKVGSLSNTVVFFLSKDSGFKWTSSVSTYATESNQPGSMSISADGSLCLAGWGGEVFTSTDGGESWKRVSLSLSQTLHRVATFNASLALVVGTTLQNTPFAMITTDGGDTMVSVKLPSQLDSSALNGAVFLNAETWLLATSAGEIWRTTNFSATWSLGWAAVNVSWSDLAYLPAWNAILAVGSTMPCSDSAAQCNGTGGALGLSLDGGQTWTLSSPQSGFPSFNRVIPFVPSAAASASPSPSPDSDDFEETDVLIVALSIALGLAGVLLMVAAVAVVLWYRRRNGAYQPINSPNGEA